MSQSDATVVVSEAGCRQLLVALGYHSCDGCSRKALEARVNKLPGLMQDATAAAERPEDVALQTVICKALEDGRRVVVKPDKDDVGEEEGEIISTKEAAVKINKINKTKKAGKGVGDKPAKAKKAKPAEEPVEEARKTPAKARKVEKESPEKGEPARKVGVGASIEEFLRAASEAKPITKQQILAKLEKRFPDRRPEGMLITVTAHMRVLRERGVEVSKNDDGYWIE